MAARSCGIDRQTLRDWVHRYTAEGLAGLADRKASGRAAKLTPEQKQHLAAWIEAGPDVATDGVVRCRWVELHVRQGVIRGRDARAHDRQAVGGPWLCSALGALAASHGQ